MPRAKSKKTPETYPCVARWLEAHGTIEIGYCYHTKSFIRAFDEGSMIWKSQLTYESFDAAMAACEKGVGNWLRDELQEEI